MHPFPALPLLFAALLLAVPAAAQDAGAPPFAWPEGRRAALSLTFDDARASQVDVALPLLGRYGVQATFYVVPSTVEPRLDGWRAAVAAGHEIGNHSLAHPCSGNFAWARNKALETFTLADMRLELTGASQRVEALLGVRPETFAYPCGQTFVGRGTGVQSYVPLVAELFLAGRGWRDEGPNDPAFCDLAQLAGVELDGLDFDALLPVLEQARAQGAWLILAGHEVGRSGPQTTRTATLDRLLRYVQDPANGFWTAPVAEVARYVRDRRAAE